MNPEQLPHRQPEVDKGVPVPLPHIESVHTENHTSFPERLRVGIGASPEAVSTVLSGVTFAPEDMAQAIKDATALIRAGRSTIQSGS